MDSSAGGRTDSTRGYAGYRRNPESLTSRQSDGAARPVSYRVCPYISAFYDAARLTEHYHTTDIVKHTQKRIITTDNTISTTAIFFISGDLKQCPSGRKNGKIIMVSVYSSRRGGGGFFLPPSPTPYNPDLLNVQTSLSSPKYYIWNSQTQNYTVNKYCELLSCHSLTDYYSNSRQGFTYTNLLFWDDNGDQAMDTTYIELEYNIGGVSVECPAIIGSAYFFFYDTSYSTTNPSWVTVKTGYLTQNDQKCFVGIDMIGRTYDKVLVLIFTCSNFSSPNTHYPCLCEKRKLEVVTDYDQQIGSTKTDTFYNNNIVLPSKFASTPVVQSGYSATFKLAQWPTDNGPKQSDFVWIEAKNVEQYGVFTLDYDLSHYTQNQILANSQIPKIELTSESPSTYTI